jgi:outer membrane protein insertion porin family
VDPFGLKQPMPVSVSKDGLINLLPAVDELVARMKGDLMGLDRVVDIEVEGNVALDREVVLMRLTTKKGDTVDFKTINTDVKTVYDLGYFDDVKAVLRDASGGKKLIVRVVEKRRIRPSASKRQGDQGRRNLHGANSEGAGLTPRSCREIAAIREMYLMVGFYNAIHPRDRVRRAGPGQAQLRHR